MVLLFLIASVLYSELVYPGGLLWKFVLLLVSGLYVFFKPIDDLALDSRYFYHLKRSPIAFFSRADKYEIGTIKSIKVAGIYSPEFEIMGLLGSGFSNSIEIIFKNNSSMTLYLQIYKKELVFVISKVNKLMHGN